MKSSLLKNFFEAKSIAVIGASSNPLRIGGRPIKYLIEQKYSGKIYPVNPKYSEVMNLPCYSNINHIPENVDLAILAVAAEQVEAEIEKCIEKGISNYVIFSSGFAEANYEGKQLQERLKNLAEKHNLTILGPNCLGMINVSKGIVASFTTALESHSLIKGGLSFVSQSGALAAYFLDIALKKGVGLSKWVSTGNEMSLNAAHFIDYLVDDKDTKVIGVYLEDIKDGNLFKNSAIKAAKKGKPIVVIKAGSSEVGKKAAASHTGSMSGEDYKYQALFEQLGIIRVKSLNELIRVSQALLYQGFPTSDKLAVVTVSGGAGVLIADEAAKFNLKVSEFDNKTVKSLKSTIPSFTSVQNPLDVTGHIVSDVSIFENTLQVLKNDTNTENVVIFIGAMKSISNQLLEAIKRSQLIATKNVYVIWIGITEDIIEKFELINIPVYEDIPEAIETIAKIYQGYLGCKSVLKETMFHSFLDEYKNKKNTEKKNGNVHLTEYETKKLFNSHNIPIPNEVLITNENEAVEEMRKGTVQYPIALKIQSREMLHKSDVGGLLLNISSEEQLIQGVNQLLKLVEQLQIDIQGILIQEMINFDQELIVGFQNDERLGPTLTIGRGGIYVEILKDIETVYLPVSKEYLKKKILGLKSSKLFEGYRGKKAVDIDKLTDLILELSEIFLKNCDNIVEFEINPLVINTETGEFWLLDGLATVKYLPENANLVNT